jgi:hypothetical protein
MIFKYGKESEGVSFWLIVYSQFLLVLVLFDLVLTGIAS